MPGFKFIKRLKRGRIRENKQPFIEAASGAKRALLRSWGRLTKEEQDRLSVWLRELDSTIEAMED